MPGFEFGRPRLPVGLPAVGEPAPAPDYVWSRTVLGGGLSWGRQDRRLAGTGAQLHRDWVEVSVLGRYVTVAWPWRALVREVLWSVHNLVAHPLSEVTHWVGYVLPAARRFGLWLHDVTVPDHEPGTGRG